MQFEFNLRVCDSEFGYSLLEESLVKKKVFSAIDFAKANSVDLIIFPELSTCRGWLEEAKANTELVIIFGSYYENNFNTCPVIINGHITPVKKIHPSNPYEGGEIVKGCKMSSGDEISIFQTNIGSFAVLICMDFIKESRRLLNHASTTNFILVPERNDSINLFQQQGNVICQDEIHPYVIQVNAFNIEENRNGGTCVIG